MKSYVVSQFKCSDLFLCESEWTFTPRSVSQGGNGGGHAHARFICSLDEEGCVSPLLSALTAARGYWETDRLWVLLDGRGAHGSTRCSLSTVGLTAEWFVLSSLQTPQKSPKTPVKVAGFVAFDKKKSRQEDDLFVL